MASTVSHALASSAVLYTVAPFAVIAIALTLVRLYTTWSYYASLKQFIDSPKSVKQTVEPPQIPYTLPGLGQTFSFLAPHPGQFWTRLFSWHPRDTGICTLLIGGRKTHILFSPPAVAALFRARAPSRDVFEREMYETVFNMPDGEVRKVESTKNVEHETNNQYLVKHERVNELTAHFTQALDEVLGKDAEEIGGLDDVGIFHWLRDRMFTASTNTLMGEKLLEMYPEFCEDFFKFDNEFLSFLFRLPKFTIKQAFQRRQRILSNLQRWNSEILNLAGGTVPDPDGPAWEPLYGSRLNRARHAGYKLRHLNPKTSAALDLGIVFGISSNAIPATGWMLMHILSPNAPATLLPSILAEIRISAKPNGSLDVPTLMSQPLLQSLWTETLRLYTDALVTRNLPEDLALPLDEDGKRVVQLRKGDNVFAPSWLGHHDPAAWSGNAPYTEFHAERFVVTDPETGKETFSMGASNGKFFPFGGGKTICPGRVFAKQEALGALAMILLRFEFEVKGFVDADKKATAAFPGLARAFAGSGVLAPGGDLKVKIRRREK